MSCREVLLEGPSPWGFRMTGGSDVPLSLRISRVNPGSKAAAKGVREGDLITSINKQPTKSLTNAESHALLRTVKENLLLGLNQDPDASPKRKGQKDKHQTQVEPLPPQLPPNDSANKKGDKKSASKLRRDRRRKLKSRIKGIFGIGKKDEDNKIREKSMEDSERSASRNDDTSECRSDVTSAKFSEDNCSLYYDNDSTNELNERLIESPERRISESETRKTYNDDNHKNIETNKYAEDVKSNENYSQVVSACSEYLMSKGRDGQELSRVPPDIILSSDRNVHNQCEIIINKQVVNVENNTSTTNAVNNESVRSQVKSNDLNNNKSGDKKKEAICSDKVSAKIVQIFHSSDECMIDEMILDNTDKKQNIESVECLPERTVNLCKAIVSFEDSGCKSLENSQEKPFIVLEDDATLIANSRGANINSVNEEQYLEELNSSRTGQVPMYHLSARRFLDVIKEEPSDVSSDGEKPKEMSPAVTSSGESRCEYHPGGIDTSWRDGKSLDDVSDVPIASDSLSDSDLLIDDAKPPKSPSISFKSRIYQNINVSKSPLNKKPPSVHVVKSVVASLYNNKSQAITIDKGKDADTERLQVCPSVTHPPNIVDDVEVVYIDSSDSDALSLKSDHLGNSSHRSSLELIAEELYDELRKDCEVESKKTEKVAASVPQVQVTLIQSKEDFEKEKYSEEIIDLSHTIINEIAENLSSGANSRRTSARSTPCRLRSTRSTPCKEITKVNGSLESVKNAECDEEMKSSSCSSHSTTKFMFKPIPTLRELSTEVIFDLPHGKTVLKKLGLDPNVNYDSGSDCFPETSEYSEPSRLSFTSTEEIYVSRSQSDIPQHDTDPERPLSSCGASSIVFISGSGPGKLTCEPWIGLPLTEDPRFVVCFSPSQLTSSDIKIDQRKASELLDLHKKFIHRRGYHESTGLKPLDSDLMSIDTNFHEEKGKSTSEILSEANNLLALEQYRKNRCNKSTKNDETIKDNCIEKYELNLGLDADYGRGGTKCISEHNEVVGSSRLLELIQKEEVKSSTSPETTMLVETTNVALNSLSNFDTDEYSISKRGDIAIRKPNKSEIDKERPKSLPPNGEIFRRVMYQEYMDKVAERMERRQKKVIKVSETKTTESASETGKHLELEFMNKVRERMEKLGLKENENEEEESEKDENESKNLPKHLKEFVEILNDESGVWSPAGTPEAERKKFNFTESTSKKEDKKLKEEEEEPGTPVWTPRSAGASPTPDRKYRPINFQSPPPQRKEYRKQDDPELPKDLPIKIVSSTSEGSSLSNNKLPPAQNPVITLLQKAREGQIPKGAQYLEQVESSRSERISEATVGRHEILYSVKKEYESDSEESKKKVVELTPRKFEGIGPVNQQGTPIALRSEVKEDNHQKWYKRMYDSLHKADHDNLLPYTGWSSGYLSEPDRLHYDSDASITSKYATLDRRRAKSTRDTSSISHSEYANSTLPRNTSRYQAGLKHAVDVYKNQPGRIEDYEPGHSSIADKEKQQWLNEVMDIFDGEFKGNRSELSRVPVISGSPGKSFTSVFSKDGGYDSDSTLIFKRRGEGNDLSLEEKKMAYKAIQRGGDVPLHGFRQPAPNKPKEPARPRHYAPPYTSSPESGREYIESEVNIHYKTPVRVEHKEYIEEGELARRQAEALRRIYQQQRRNKYLAELNDIHSRRHQDYFTPLQKSPIPLNRYDDFPHEVAPPRPRDRTPEPKLVARALYNFVGQSSRELTFRRGDIIFVRRQIDKNWYEGEHNAMIGLFPINYVEIIPYDGIRTLPKKSTEGQARAKFNFQAQTHLELSLVKGELVLLTRRVDENWFEGRIGNKKGIFPVSYVQVLVEPGEVTYSGGKPVVAPASHSVMLNGAKDIGSQLQPPRPPSVGSPTVPMTKEERQISQILHIDNRSDPVPYRAMYNYKPQNDDELELREGDVVYVMEKCDDGWYVGSLHRNGQFGTFPGNYVQRIP